MRVKELEADNAKVKRRYAELALDNVAMKDLITKKMTIGLARKREAVRYLMGGQRARSVPPLRLAVTCEVWDAPLCY